MTTLSILTLAMLGASQVWTESSLVDVYPDSGPTLAAGEDIRLYAARGEWESFQLCVQAGRNGMSGVAIQSESPHATIPEPEIRRVGYLSTASPSSRAYRNESMHPDPLIPFDGANLEPDETLALWVTYYIPPETPSGIHRGKLTVSQDRGRSFPVEVTIEVFDMTLSKLPALRSLAPLDRDMMRAFYGIDSDAVEAWAPYYDAFAGSRLSLSLWHGYGLVHLDGEGNANAARFKEHLSFAIDRHAMNTINVANGAFGLDPFPPPAADGSDPLQRYLEDMGDWLTEQDWINRAVILPLSMPPREYWPAARGLYDRIKTADSRFKRLLAGAPHPFFEQYAEVWAVPLRHYHPQSLGRLQEGMSLSTPLPYTARSIQASSSGYLDDIDMYATEPEDAYDGSLFTAWCSASPPTSERPQWFELRFDDPIETDQISIDWEPGFEAEAMRLSIAPYGTRMTSASARWEHRLARGPHERSQSTGQLRTSWRFEAIRIEFLRSRRGGPVAIRQLEFGREPDPSSIAAIPPVETWLCPLDGDFPGLENRHRGGIARFRQGGLRRYWMGQALDQTRVDEWRPVPHDGFVGTRYGWPRIAMKCGVGR